MRLVGPTDGWAELDILFVNAMGVGLPIFIVGLMHMIRSFAAWMVAYIEGMTSGG